MSDSFTSEFEYHGNAEVTFTEPHAILRGPATVKLEEGGKPILSMTIEQSSIEIRSDFDVAALTYGAQQFSDAIVIPVGEYQNRLRISLQTDHGTFRGGPEWDYSFSNVTEGESLTLQARFIKSEYRATTDEQAHFLLLPLINFSAELPCPGTGPQENTWRLAPPAGSRSVIFEVNGRHASIHRFPASHVQGVGERAGIDGVAVLPIADPSMAGPWSWFINVFLRALALATGNDASCPWIETRSEQGRVIRRIHLGLGQSHIVRNGYSALGSWVHWQNGGFMSAILNAPEAREPFFSIALRHCIRAGEGGTLDDQLSHLMRAFECLCARYGFRQQHLSAELDAGVRDKVTSVLRGAAGNLRELERGVSPTDRPRLARIAQRLLSAEQFDKNFGLAVADLVRHFGLHDTEVLTPYYAAHPGPGGCDWLSLLSYYRGAVVHEGFLDVDSPGTQIGEVLGFILHLHDLLVRILLKIVRYEGGYQPRLIRATALETADWFKPGVQVEHLLLVPTLGIKESDA